MGGPQTAADGAAIGSPVQLVTPANASWRRPRSVEVGSSAEPQLILDKDPDRVGAWIFNAGGMIEIPIQLPGASLKIGDPLPLTAFLDSAGVQVPVYTLTTYKSLYLIVDTALTWVGPGQAKVQLLVGRQGWGPSSGAGSGAGPSNFLKGAQANFGGAAVITIAAGVYPFSPADLTDLQWHHPYVGLELAFPAALTGGAMRLMLEMPGGANLYLSKDKNVNPAVIGDRKGAFAIPAGAPPMWVPTRDELYASSSPGGSIEVLIWEAARPRAGERTDGRGGA